METRKKELKKLEEIQKQLTLIRDDLGGYTDFYQKNINQSVEIKFLRSEHFKVMKNIFEDIYTKMERDFNLVQMGNWDKSWMKSNILELKQKYLKKDYTEVSKCMTQKK